MAFPVTRLRRLRRTSQLRDMVRETRLTPEAFVYPIFVCPGEGVRKAVGSMPGVSNLSVDEAVKEAREVYSLGVPSVILFGLPDMDREVTRYAIEVPHLGALILTHTWNGVVPGLKICGPA